MDEHPTVARSPTVAESLWLAMCPVLQRQIERGETEAALRTLERMRSLVVITNTKHVDNPG